MKSERPDKKDFAERIPRLEKGSGDQGEKKYPDFVSDGSSADETAGDLPFLSPPRVIFDRKQALKKDEAEKVSDDPGYPVLIPPHVIYPRKASLKKRPAGRKILILFAEALSAAAIIIIMLTLFRKGPDTIPPDKEIGSMAQVTPGYNKEKSSDEIPAPEISVIEIPGPPYKPAIKTARPEQADTGSAVLQARSTESGELLTDVPADLTGSFERAEVSRAAIPVPVTGPAIARYDVPALMAFNGELPSQEDPGLRSNVEKFAARFFHEKIMKNEKAGDTPVTGIDLAEAWVIGVNRLLGTEMNFVRNTNEKGELVSVYFSSQTLKINAPVKRDEPSL